MRKFAKTKAAALCLILAAALICTPPIRSLYFFTKGITAFKQNYPGQSVKWLEKSVKSNPNFLEAYLCLAIAYAEWADKSMHYIQQDEESLAKLKTETLDRAEFLLNTALAKFPYHPLRYCIPYMLEDIRRLKKRSPSLKAEIR